MSRILFLFLLLGLFLCRQVGAASDSRPAIIWASSPIAPNETVMLQVGNTSKEAKVQLVKLNDGRSGNTKLFTNPVAIKWILKT